MLGDEEALAIRSLEARVLGVIGLNKHVIGSRKLIEDGILLEHAHFGSIIDFLPMADAGLRRRLAWARQATEAVIAIIVISPSAIFF